MAYLLKEPVKSSAATLKNLFMRDPQNGRQQIGELLDILMEPRWQTTNTSSKDELANWLKAFLSTEKSFEDFCSQVSQFDKSILCGRVWTRDFVAYRCKTCATSPCMSICAECFERGNHEGHEYNIFRSEAGGACDCGDASVMDASGFCERHGLNRVTPDNVPPSLMILPKFIMERMVIMLLHNLRFMAQSNKDLDMIPFHSSLKSTLDVFIEVMKCGSLVRSWLAELLLSEEYYNSLNENRHYGGIVTKKEKEFHNISLSYFEESSKRLPKCPMTDELDTAKGFPTNDIVYKNLLQEFTFWLYRFIFPEHLILFILNMLPEVSVKEKFSRYFVQHYVYISPSLVSAGDDVESYSNRIVHISVQLFSNKDLAYMLATEENLLETFVMSVHYMVTKALVDSKTTEGDSHRVVHPSSAGMRNNAYWAIVSDFVNCLGHHPVARLFLNNRFAFKVWMNVLMYFSGMDIVKRQVGFHVEYDGENALLTFYMEREASASTLWVMMEILQDESSLDLSKKMMEYCINAITKFFDALGLSEDDLPFDKVSFHYPLHRYYALIAANAVAKQGMKIQDLRIDERFVKKLMAHPLQVIVTNFEIQCEMWVRNGIGITTRQLAYRQALFSTFFLDADLFMLQLCSNFVTPDYFVLSIFKRCRVIRCFTFNSEVKPITESAHGAEGQPTEEKLSKMVESSLAFLMSILGIHLHLGISDREIVEREIVAVLTAQDVTYSNLISQIPQCHNMLGGEKSKRYSEPIEEAIDRHAQRVEAGAMAQTVYTLVDGSWDKYDPIFTQHRALYKSHSQKAHTKYFRHLQKTKNLPAGTLESNIWPPYSLIRIASAEYMHLNKILTCQTLHSAIFFILYKYLHGHDSISEQSLIMAISLLEASLYYSAHNPSTELLNEGQSNEDYTIPDLFGSGDMVKNIRKVIGEVQIDSFETEVFHDALQTPEEVQSQREADTDQEMPEEFISVNESILTMLIKLHERYSRTKGSFSFPNDFQVDLNPPKVPVPTGPAVIERVLLFAASASSENQQVIERICPAKPKQIQTSSTHDTERERRKQKAQEMQRRLLQDFAKKQKKFLEQAELDFDLPTDDENEGASSGDENKYRCVICGSSEEKTIDIENATKSGESVRSRIMCLIGFAQSSSVLGHRVEIDEEKSIVSSQSPDSSVENCRKSNLQNEEILKSNFPSEIGRRSLGHYFGWEWSPHVSICGHHVHITCYEEYVTWVRRDNRSPWRTEEDPPFSCPMCRQTSNIAIPCNVSNIGIPKDEPHSSDERKQGNFRTYLQRIKPRLITSEENFPGSSVDPPANEVRNACYNSITAILNKNVSFKSAEATSMLSLALFRAQLEYELCSLGGALQATKKPSNLSTVKRNMPNGHLFHVIVKSLSMDSSPNSKNDHVRRIFNELTADNVNNFNPGDCPILLKDPVALLIEMCVAIYPFSKEEFQAVAQVLYNLCLVQSLIHISCKFSPEERRAWADRIELETVELDTSRIDLLLGLVISCLPRSLFRGNGSSSTSSPQLFTSTVWTAKSVENTADDFCLNFLRWSALLQFHLFGNPRGNSSFPSAPDGVNELCHLGKYLGMVGESSRNGECHLSEFASWPNSPKLIIGRWCDALTNIAGKNRPAAVRLLTRHKVWKQPSLIPLPEDYTNLFSRVRSQAGKQSVQNPSEPCVCLLCGELVFLRGMSHHSAGMNKMSAAVHARLCGNGTTILIDINRTTVVIMREQRYSEWGTLYLDDHGEEDPGWRRGRRLSLRQRRLGILQYQWMNHIFDNVCNGWRIHREL